jgi:hypothetical protein
MSKKDNGSAAAAAQARSDEQARQATIRAGTDKINSTFDSQFTPDFYGNIKKGFLDYANPQLDQQYKDAQKELTYSLARGGNLDSSTRADQSGTLQRTYDTGKQAVADQALSYENNSKNSIEDARGNLISNLNISGDATGAANSAITRAQALSQPQAYSPIANMFSTFTSGLATQAGLERAAALSGGAITPRYNTGLFSNSGAVRVS